jgi:Cu(I)/Ag(I) efflux system membrane fusion protein
MVIPKTAVLWTGKRSVVYVKQPGDEPIFKIREIGLGPMLGDSYIIIDGLTEGEEIVTSGTFSVDAAAQLEGKPSMMNPVGGSLSTGHDHNNMTEETVKSTNMLNHDEFAVEGNCEMCKERIETAAKTIHGVKSADWIVEAKNLHITYDKSQTDIDSVKKAIADAGHDNDKFQASDKVYNRLPECCLYRKEK